jgi:hypothetical protein
MRRFESGYLFPFMLFAVALASAGFVAGLQVDAAATRASKERELLAIGRQFRAALQSYHAASPVSGLQSHPLALADLLEDRRSGALKRHLRKVFVDPMTGRAEWGLVRVGGHIVGVYSLSTARPIKRDGFDSEFQAFVDAPGYDRWVFLSPSDPLLQPSSR